MLYESTIENLRYVVRNAGTVLDQQLFRFFSDENDAYNLQYYLEELAFRRIIDYDRETGLVSWHNKPIMKEFEVKTRIYAFWIIAAMKSVNVRDVYPLGIPTPFLVLSEEGEAFDITVCTGALEAQIATRKFDAMLPTGEPDEVNHIALVPNAKIASEIGSYGFDSYCILDKKFKPRYGTWT